jgi:hypothetical protein
MIRELERADREGAHWIEVREEKIPARQRWSIQAAKWRTLELARHIFGPDASLGPNGFPPRGAFQGLVRLEVPFEDLEAHRELEARFATMAGRDELLTQVPLVFVFDPVPTQIAQGSAP